MSELVFGTAPLLRRTTALHGGSVQGLSIIAVLLSNS